MHLSSARHSACCQRRPPPTARGVDHTELLTVASTSCATESRCRRADVQDRPRHSQRACPRSRGRRPRSNGGLRRLLDGRDRPRSVPAGAAGRRTHLAAGGRDQHRRRVRAQPDDRRQPRLGSAGLLAAAGSILGLGTQVQAAHREAVQHAVEPSGAAACANSSMRCRRSGAAWQDGTRLSFEGEFYTHTLMTPMFTPEPLAAPRRRRCSSPRSARR